MDFFGSNGIIATTKVVTLTDDFHVTVGLITGEDDDRCQAILNGGSKPKTRITAHGNDEANIEQVTELSMEMEQYREAYLASTIREWNLTENGQTAPVDLAHIKKIPPRYRNVIFLAAKEFNKPPTADELGESTRPSTSS